MIGAAARLVLNACAITMLVACGQSLTVTSVPRVYNDAASSSRDLARGCPLKRCIIVGSQPGYRNRPRASVLFFSSESNGNVPPVAEIRGSKTRLGFPAGLATDSRHDIYVANTGPDAITVYAANSQGNVAPIRVISGFKTRLYRPTGIAIDARDQLYVANQRNDITIYAAKANGDAAPVRVIKGKATKLYAPWGLAFDSQSNLYVANNDPNNGWITVYAPNAAGNAPPERTIRGSATKLQGPTGLAVDASGYLYVVNASSVGSLVTIFAPGANGNQAPLSYFSGGYAAFGVALGHHRIYVTSVGYDDYPFIATFDGGAVGNYGDLLRKIQGRKTKMISPEGIIVR
ncbi:MAG: hypothetical protein JO030_05280 [Candidatus Eremiobacteraeota bacterium]|nr:hypothetical protein [Candidatus Eremiobacteraeota bacterium]